MYERMLLAYYGELTAAEQTRFDQELAQSEHLRTQYQQLTLSLGALTDAPIHHHEPSEDFFTALEYNIHAAVRRDAAVQPLVHPIQSTSWLHSLKDLFTPQRIGFTLAGGLVCALIGVFTGVKMQNSWIAPQNVAAIGDQTALPTAASSEQVKSFLKRSQIYFATSVDEEVKCEKCVPLKQQMNNKKIASELLKEAAALRAQSKNNPELEKLVTDIEFVLNNISNDAVATQAQAEMVHHIASNAMCEVTSKIDTAHTQTRTQPK